MLLSVELADTTQSKVRTKIEGPFASDVIVHKDGEAEEREEHPCTSNPMTLRVTLEIKIKREGKDENEMIEGYVKGGKKDRKIQQVLNLNWKRCEDVPLDDSE